MTKHAELRSIGTNRVILTLVEFETHDVLKGNGGKSAKRACAGTRDMFDENFYQHLTSC
jgi:hypothetical protein